MEWKRVLVMSMAALALAAVGCGDDDGDGDPVDSGPGADSGPPGDIDSGPPGDVDSGPPGDVDSGPPGDIDSGPPAGGCPAMFADCATFEDRTAGGAMNRLIETVPAGITFAYDPKCIRVNVGQEVTIEASALHPLNGACGPGDMNPIMDGATTNQMVTFTAPGIYGFNCENHGAPDGSGMAGAIEVVMP